ncbi:MAG: hypothetical protein IJP02_02630 [Oscillospiraceae bacterium]|nr:hypothetical protein [Oscillospiraceae bacterium]
MVGVLWGCEGGRVRLERRYMAGLWVLAALVPCGGRQGRRCARAARLLVRAGVRRMVVNRSFDMAALTQYGLEEVDVGELYRHMAARLTLTWLERRGMTAERSTAVLCGSQVSPALSRTAEQLCPCMQNVIIRAGWGSERLQSRLYERYGMAAGPIVRERCVWVRFDGPDGGEDLYLEGAGLRTGAMTVRGEGVEVPPGLDADSFLCALWQAGVIEKGKLRVEEE